jgi:OOP family OmpA-OmpF porin
VQGRKTDFVFQFGGGLKVPLHQDLFVRAEFRENLHNRTNPNFGGIAFSEELTLGLAFKWGHRSSSAAASRDRDRDGLADELDACPELPALSDDGCPVDSDGDGIFDADDACPNEHGPLENGCPDRDLDGDGVPLPCDQCPEVQGIAPLGCPDDDPDKDGLSGAEDECPSEAEVYNGYLDADGCPDEVPKEVEKFTGNMQGITFGQ